MKEVIHKRVIHCKVLESRSTQLCDKNIEFWFEKNSVFAVAECLAKTQRDPFLLSPASLWRRMNEKGLILVTEAQESGTPKLTVKRVIGGRSKRVMILSADLLESE